MVAPPTPVATATSPLLYDVEARPPLGRLGPLGLQHLVAMLLGNVTPPLLIAGGLGLDIETTAFLLQMSLVMAGVATIVQSYPVGPIGARLPVVMGTSIAFVGAIVAIGRAHGLAVVFGACAVAALVEVLIGGSIGRLRGLFPPLVNGVVVMLIGLTLIPVGMDYAAGGVGSASYGELRHLGLALLVFVVTVALNQLSRGFVGRVSVLVGVVVGYLVALGIGRVDLGPIGEAAWVALPRPIPFGLDLELTPVLVLAAVYVISTMETIGDLSGTVAAAGREPTTAELRGGLLADGVMSGLAALIGAFPNTSYSQNVGLVNFTGVVSRHVTAVTGLLLVLLGLVPKVGALFATIPPEVIGGAGLVMFAMIFASGLAIVHRSVPLTRRNLVILAVGIGIGLAVELRPAALAALPEGLRSFFGSGLISGGLAALLLSAWLPDADQAGSDERTR